MKHMKLWRTVGGLGLVLAWLLGTAAPAWADIPQPETSACSAKALGDECDYSPDWSEDDTVSGECIENTCTRIAGSDPDGGVIEEQYACLWCEEGEEEAEAAAAAEDEDDGCSTSGAGTPAAAPIGLALVAAALGWAGLRWRRRQ